MKHGCATLLLLTGSLGYTATLPAQEKLSDAELDAITAGTAGEREDERLRFDLRKTTRRGTAIDGDAALDVGGARAQADSLQLLLRDSAQSNLRSLVNINAVNSPVNVLLNLNINVDSNVGELRQINLTQSPRD